MNNQQTLKHAGQDLKHAQKDVANVVSSTAESAYQTARQTLSGASEQLSEGYDMARQELKKLGSQFEGMVKQRPIVAVAVAAGVGLLLGRLVAPRFGGSRD